MEISLASDFADGRVGHATIAMRIVHGFCASRRQSSKPCASPFSRRSNNH